MQQTQHYKLNLIQPDDPFSPQPLNENTQKLDAALARVDAAVDDLGPRVTALEVHKMVVGTYTGNGGTQTVSVGFTPKAVILPTSYLIAGMFAEGFPLRDQYCGNCATIVEGGFQIRLENHADINSTSKQYVYLALC